MEVSPKESSSTAEEDMRKSALQDNLERKGKNAYYFAHAHKATGPAWDGKVEPQLISRHATTEGHKLSVISSSFDYSKSNITTYSFLDDWGKVKLYLDFDFVGEKCTDEDVTLDFTDRSLLFSLCNYKEETQILNFGRLTASISAATYRVKKDKIVITLTKVDADNEWHTINDKGAPDHELV